MGFASAWLAKNALYPQLIDSAPEAGTGIIVVIPSFAEEEIEKTIKSLAECEAPPCHCEVIVIVNAPGTADQNEIETNKRTISILKAWSDIEKCFFRLYFFDTGVSELPDWGIGFARKTGMDEALRRFDLLSQPSGIIASLDADCRVSHNYFTALYEKLFSDRAKTGCSMNLINAPDCESAASEQIQAAEIYELGRRYMRFGMRYAGYPWCIDTSGAAMAIKADVYARAGGMNKRMAGEDFWFLRKIIPTGGFFNAHIITVFHSPRLSARVPFGTGMSVIQLLTDHEKAFMIYDPSLFDNLCSLWRDPQKLFRLKPSEIGYFYNNLPSSIKEFINEEKFCSNVCEISSNTSTSKTFTKRYYTRFDYLFGLRYINSCVRKEGMNENIVTACSILALKAGFKKTEIFSFYSALSFYRDSEAWISYSPF